MCKHSQLAGDWKHESVQHGYYVSFILWKDYNCFKWFTYDNNKNPSLYYSYDDSGSGYYNSAIIQVYNAFKVTNSAGYQNPWLSASNLVDSLVKDSKTSGSAFTVIATNGYNQNYYGRFCAVNFSHLGNLGILPSFWGAAVLIQTR